MVDTTAPGKPRSGWALFQWLFLVAAFLAAAVTFVAVSGMDPIEPVSRDVQAMIIANTLIIITLGIIVVQRYRASRTLEKGAEGNRLARRFLLLFSLSAVIPALVVSVFLWAAISRGFDTWFGERVFTLVEQTATVARENVDEYSDALEEDTRLAASDINNALEGLTQEPEAFSSYLGMQALIRNMRVGYVIDREGRPLAIGENASNDSLYRRPTPDMFDEADAGEVYLSLFEAEGFTTSLIKLGGMENAYLYLAKPLDRDAFARLRRAEQALEEYRIAGDMSSRSQALFFVAYGQIVALVLLMAIRLALEAASRITGPIGRLANAAQSVRDGDLDIRVPLPQGEDEVRALTRSFNVMTEQLGAQRSALIYAREEAEDRRLFLETLLEEVSAGVIRIDESFVVTLANPSAQKLLEAEPPIDGCHLSEIAPAFMPHVEEAMATRLPIDASLDMRTAGGARHFRLKAARDSTGGLVLTFDDATRLVTAQRQLAWRDVARRIAHEIRNPLTPIQLSAERIRRRYSQYIPEDDTVFDKCTDTILRQVSDIGRMVEEFSGFARMPKPTLESFDLAQLIDETGFSQQVVSPDIDVEIKHVRKPLIISADERLLGQAIGNIVKNAAEAIERRPENDEAKGGIEITTEDTEDFITIIIEDNGPGFPEEARERLLEPYVTTREKGTGLGLAIVNRIIVDHGGAIQLQERDESRSGAKVRITLPKQANLDEFAEPETTEALS
ncbi:sensor histidine kinase NtrY-like [Henriciella barbarensis]|uniref:sensor histidine kinase NtrY-like n=1 Tax=Henriciella barbarensis TaxID=86342 RepID=UPI0011C46E35|nr:PAS domain-containing sensor histidine kinase [Henriciella barbarensis]